MKYIIHKLLIVILLSLFMGVILMGCDQKIEEQEDLVIPDRTLLSTSAKDFGIPVEYGTVYFNEGSEYMLYKTYEMEDYLAALEYLQKNKYEVLTITTAPISSSTCYMITFKIKGDKEDELLFNNVESKESSTEQ